MTPQPAEISLFTDDACSNLEGLALATVKLSNVHTMHHACSASPKQSGFPADAVFKEPVNGQMMG